MRACLNRLLVRQGQAFMKDVQSGINFSAEEALVAVSKNRSHASPVFCFDTDRVALHEQAKMSASSFEMFRNVRFSLKITTD